MNKENIMKIQKLLVTILVITFVTFSAIKAQSKLTQDDLDSMLLEACEKGDLAAAKTALAKKANPNATGSMAETPLMIAARHSNFSLISLLLNAGANPVMQDDLGHTAADVMGIDAIGTSDVDSTVLIMAGDKVQKRLTEAAAEAKKTAEDLVTAITENKTSTAIELINKGAYLDFIDKRSELHPTPLTTAVSQKNLEILKLLLSKGVRVDRSDAKDRTPLLLAILNKDNESAGLLLKSKADVNEHDQDGFTPIIAAAAMGNVEMVKLLLQNKAGVNYTTNTTGDSALHWAISGKHPEIVPLLLKAGANPNLQDLKGGTPLVFAAGVGDLESAILLLKSGANPNLKTKSGGTALDYAKKGNRTEIIKILTDGTYTKAEFKTP